MSVVPISNVSVLLVINYYPCTQTWSLDLTVYIHSRSNMSADLHFVTKYYNDNDIQQTLIIKKSDFSHEKSLKIAIRVADILLFSTSFD